MDRDRVFQLSHKTLQGRVASIQHTAYFCTYLHSALIRIPSLGQDGHVCQQFRGLLGKLIDSFGVGSHTPRKAASRPFVFFLPHFFLAILLV
jgi:hypothetical protein